MTPETKAKRPLSILFVEDDELILELQASILAAKYPDTVLYTALNGRLGLELFKKYAPEIVLTDINMAEMCGVQMATAIRALKPDTRIIAVTGKSEKSFLQNSGAKEFEFDHVIVKPVVLTELFAAIEQCMGELAHHDMTNAACLESL